VLVTGALRGIGHGLVRQCQEYAATAGAEQAAAGRRGAGQRHAGPPGLQRGAGGKALGGKPTIESLGLPGFGYHSNQAEYVLIDAIPRRLYLAARMVMDLGQGKQDKDKPCC